MADDTIILNDDEATGASPISDDNENIVTNPDGSKTLTLKYPQEVKYQVRGAAPRVEKLTTLTFRRPNGGDMRATENIISDQKRGMVMFTRLADIHEAVFDKLDMEDIEVGMILVSDFLPKSPPTGEKS